MIQRVLSQFDLGNVQGTEELGGAGGFSGAELWRIEADVGRLCLRRWPVDHPNEAGLRRMHNFLLEAQRQLLPVPAPLPTRAGATYVRQHGAWWELTHWMPGVADYHCCPSPARLVSALTTLAQLHLAAAKVETPVSRGSTIVKRRFEMLAEVPERTVRLRAACSAVFAIPAVSSP